MRTSGSGVLGRFGRRRASQTVNQLAGYLLPFLIFFGLWQLLGYANNSTFSAALASPSSTVARLVDDWAQIGGPLRTTALEAILGYLCGNALGLIAAFVFDLSRTLGRVGMLAAVIVQSIPVIAFSAVLIVWFGNGLLPRIMIAAYISFFPMLLNVERGLRSIGRSEVALFKAFGASRWRVLRSLKFPAILPATLTALKASAVLAVGGAIVAELFGAQSGLGILMENALYYNAMTLLWGAIYLAAALSLGLFMVAALLQKRFAWW